MAEAVLWSVCWQGGMYLLQLLDHHVCSGTTLLLLALCQSISIGWVYGEVTAHLGRLSRQSSS